jgi:hypothetical protein
VFRFVYTCVFNSNCFYKVSQCVYNEVFNFEVFLRRVSVHSYLSVQISTMSVTCYNVFIDELLQYLVLSIAGHEMYHACRLSYLFTYLLNPYPANVENMVSS